MINFNFFMNDVVRQAREEIVSAGYTELTTPEAVEEAFKRNGTTLVMVTLYVVVQVVLLVLLLRIPYIMINVLTTL